MSGTESPFPRREMLADVQGGRKERGASGKVMRGLASLDDDLADLPSVGLPRDGHVPDLSDEPVGVRADASSHSSLGGSSSILLLGHSEARSLDETNVGGKGDGQ